MPKLAKNETKKNNPKQQQKLKLVMKILTPFPSKSSGLV